MTGDVIASFAKFMKKVGKDKTALVMHTSIGDPEGQNILEVAKCFGADANLVVSQDRVAPEMMSGFYNAADVTVNIANNEGFGLGTLESLMCGTPILVSMTGGLQFQVGGWWQTPSGELVEGITHDQDKMADLARAMWGDGRDKHERFFGIPVFPASRSCTGSQPIPYIYDDRVAHEDVVQGLLKLYAMGRDGRRRLGKRGSEWARKTFNMDTMISDWDRVIQEQLIKFAVVRPTSLRAALI